MGPRGEGEGEEEEEATGTCYSRVFEASLG
jgi:hypothetical protein